MIPEHAKGAYDRHLAEISVDYPAIADLLRAPHRARTERLARIRAGRRLAGFDELLGYSSQLETAYVAREPLRPISFLITRCRSDLAIALESVLSAAPSVVVDAMRDLMEVELLLREFRYEPEQIEIWLSVEEKTRCNNFSPGTLRARHAQRVKKDSRDLPEAACYKLHSQLLHVTPRVSPTGPRGVGVEQHPFALDLCFGEIFEHARRVLFEAFDLLTAVVADNVGVPCPKTGLPSASEAWISTQVVFGVSLAVLAGADAKRTGNLGDAHGYDTEHLTLPATMAFHYFLRALELTDEEKVFDGEEEVPRHQVLAAVVSMCVEEAKKEVLHW